MTSSLNYLPADIITHEAQRIKNGEAVGEPFVIGVSLGILADKPMEVTFPPAGYISWRVVNILECGAIYTWKVDRDMDIKGKVIHSITSLAVYYTIAGGLHGIERTIAPAVLCKRGDGEIFFAQRLYQVRRWS